MRLAATTAVLIAAVAALTAQPRALRRAEIDAAIAFGETREPRPYLLRHQGQPDNPVVVGAVYTPFLRVALLAKAAALRGERLTAADVSATVLEPLVYIAFRWYCCDTPPVDGDLAFDAAEPRVVMLPIDERAPQFVRFTKDERHGAVRPVWLRKGHGAVEAFGGHVPYDDVVLVAAFPSDAIQPGRPFAIYKTLPDRESVRIGVVRRADALAWR